MGWEAEQVTTYEYDGDRLVRSVVTTAPEWDSEQRDLMLALATYEADIGPHGIPMSEALDPANAYDPETGGAFRAEPITDHAQAAVARAEAKHRADWPDDPMYGLSFIPVKR